LLDVDGGREAMSVKLALYVPDPPCCPRVPGVAGRVNAGGGGGAVCGVIVALFGGIGTGDTCGVAIGDADGVAYRGAFSLSMKVALYMPDFAWGGAGGATEFDTGSRSFVKPAL
jgi:hypothetical protein